MTIAVGDTLPLDVQVNEMVDGKPAPVTVGDIAKGKKIVLFSVPGAFTPTCSNAHLPGFVDKAADIKSKGVDEIVCMAVNDAFVMGAWGEAHGAGDNVRMVGDGNGALAEALGLTLDASGFGMGKRSQRFALVANDGVVEELLVEPGPGLDVSSAETVLSKLG